MIIDRILRREKDKVKVRSQKVTLCKNCDLVL